MASLTARALALLLLIAVAHTAHGAPCLRNSDAADCNDTCDHDDEGGSRDCTCPGPDEGGSSDCSTIVMDGTYDINQYLSAIGILEGCFLPDVGTFDGDEHYTCTQKLGGNLHLPTFDGLPPSDNNPPAAGWYRLVACTGGEGAICSSLDPNSPGGSVITNVQRVSVMTIDDVCDVEDIYKWGIAETPSGVALSLTFDSEGGDVDISTTVPVVFPAVAWHVGIDPHGEGADTFMPHVDSPPHCSGSVQSGDLGDMFWPRGGTGTSYSGSRAAGWGVTEVDSSEDWADNLCPAKSYSVSFTDMPLADLLACNSVNKDTSDPNIIRWSGDIHATALMPVSLATDPAFITDPDYKDFTAFDYTLPFEFFTYTSIAGTSDVAANADVDFYAQDMHIEYSKPSPEATTHTASLKITIRSTDAGGGFIDGGVPTGFTVKDSDGNDIAFQGTAPTFDQTDANTYEFETGEEAEDFDFSGTYTFEFADNRKFIAEVDQKAVALMHTEQAVTITLEVSGGSLGGGGTFATGDTVGVAVNVDTHGLDVDVSIDTVMLCFGQEALQSLPGGVYSGGCRGVDDSQLVVLYDGTYANDAVFGASGNLANPTNTPTDLSFNAYPLATRTYDYMLHLEATVSEAAGGKRSVVSFQRGLQTVEVAVGQAVETARVLRIVPNPTRGSDKDAETSKGSPDQSVLIGALVAALVAVNVVGVVVLRRMRRRRRAEEQGVHVPVDEL